MQLKIRLRQVSHDIDFRKSEATNFVEFSQQRGNKELVADMRRDDAILFVSLSRQQLCFVWGATKLDDKRYVVASVRLRLAHGTWNPLMLANYAERVGIELIGIRKFEEIYAEQRQRREVAPNGHIHDRHELTL